MAGAAAQGEEKVPSHVRGDHGVGGPGDSCGGVWGVLLLEGEVIDGLWVMNKGWGAMAFGI